jgi:cytoskeletal protein CcmA (bactofilin family)
MMRTFASILLLLFAGSTHAGGDPSSELEALLNKLDELQERIPALVNRVEELETKAGSQQELIAELEDEDRRRLQSGCSITEVTDGSNTYCELTSSLTVEADVDITGDAKIVDADTVHLAGDLVTGNATINGDAEISGPLTVRGDLELQTTNLPVTFAGDLVIDEDLDVHGDTKLGGDVDFKSKTDIGSSNDMKAGVAVEGDVVTEGDLTLEGDVDFNDVVTMEGDEVLIDVPATFEEVVDFESEEFDSDEESGEGLEEVVMEEDVEVDELTVNKKLNDRRS